MIHPSLAIRVSGNPCEDPGRSDGGARGGVRGQRRILHHLDRRHIHRQNESQTHRRKRLQGDHRVRRQISHGLTCDVSVTSAFLTKHAIVALNASLTTLLYIVS